MSRSATSPDDLDDPPTQLRVRPYLLTGGRTQGDVELNLESVLGSTDQGVSTLPELHLEAERIVALCQEPMSLTELAARLELSLQVARVLSGDLITDGLLHVHAAADFTSERPDLSLLTRVLDGLQSL